METEKIESANRMLLKMPSRQVLTGTMEDKTLGMTNTHSLAEDALVEMSAEIEKSAGRREAT